MKQKLKYFIFSIITVFLFSACSINPFATKEATIYEPEANLDASQISSYHHESLAIQEEATEKILAEYSENTYTFEDPFIKLDPYDAAPLSALVLFETDEPVRIDLFVGLGKDEAPIIKNFGEEKTAHEIPVLGLYPDKENKVVLRATNRHGVTREKTLSIQTGSLPEDLSSAKLVTANPTAMEEGLTFIIPNAGKIYAVDANADVRWYSSIDTRIVFNLLENGHYLQTAYVEADEANSLLMERDFLGKLHHAYHIDIEGYDSNNLIHHDVIEMASGNLLATTHEPNSKYIEDHMHEIDRETGETTQELNVREKMPQNASKEYEGKNADKNDWLHQNAIWPDDQGKSILISGRSQDAILKLSYPENEIEWILAANEDWPEDYQDKLLEPIGKVDFPAGQHAVKIVETPDKRNTGDTKDIILFDNNDVIVRGNQEVNREFSQAVRYRINEKEQTVEQIWDYGKHRGEDFHSSIVGNVQYLYNKDNILLNSGALKDGSYDTEFYGKVVEVDALTEDSEEFFELDIYRTDNEGPKLLYRAYRYPLYPDNWSYTLSEDAESSS